MGKVEMYKDKAGEWRWHATADNNRIIGASTEGYKNKIDCEKNIEQLEKVLMEYRIEQKKNAIKEVKKLLIKNKFKNS